uniref:Ribonuclease H-like domain-containing protein n=1 Tax=Tanacetum cinerariifolium TaxID=118510 RepID=A0A6L2JR44_TANCI|nr:ribonuclease H-like domain-containing protein [Tanacetum cinerariifolium]
MKRTRRDHDRRVIILPPMITEEHIAVQRESKARTTLLQSIPDDHVADFHYMDDAKDIWNAIKARFGGNAESKKMRKSMLKQEFSEFRIDDEDINLKFLRALPSSWSQNQAILHLLVPPVLAKRCQIEIVQIILQLLPTMFHQTLRLDNVIEDVLQSFVADTEPEQLAYEDFKHIEKLDLEEMDLKWFNKKKVRCYKCQQRGHFAKECREKGGNDKQRYSSFKIKEIGKKKEDSKALITVDTLVDWTDHDDESAEVITAKKFGIFAGCDSEDAIKEGAAKIYNLITGANSEEANTAGDAGEFALITKVGLGFTNCIRENELGWDDSAFSVFTTNSEDVEGRPIFYSDKSLEVNTNDFASSDSSVKSLEHHPNDSTSYASTSSDLPSFSCNSSDMNEHTSRTSCNKNGYFNKKAGHFRKHASSVSKFCFVCGKQMANKTVGIGVGLVYNRNKLNYRSQFVPQAVLLRTGKVNIPPVRPQPVPTGKPKVFTPVPTGKPKVSKPVPNGKPKVSTPVPTGRTNRPSLFPTDRGFSPSEHPFSAAEDEGIFDSGCSRRMTDTEYLVLSKDFKLSDDSMVVLRVPRKHNLYTINLHNLCPNGNLACLVAHASFDESMKWHRRMGHVNYKNMNKLVKGNLVRGLPPKLFKNDHTCVACCKGKQHKASYKAIHAVRFIFKPLQLLHMDFFGLTPIRSIDHKYYCLVITDDYSRYVVPTGRVIVATGSGGMTCQGVRKEMQTKGVIGDSIHFDALGDMQEFVKMLVGVFTWQTMKLAGILDLLNHVILQSKVRCLYSNRGNWATLPFKDGWHNSSIVWRSGTGGSPFPSAAISKSFKRVGSARDLLRIVS